jgi:hypothetical protein
LGAVDSLKDIAKMAKVKSWRIFMVTYKIFTNHLFSWEMIYKKWLISFSFAFLSVVGPTALTAAELAISYAEYVLHTGTILHKDERNYDQGKYIVYHVSSLDGEYIVCLVPLMPSASMAELRCFDTKG